MPKIFANMDRINHICYTKYENNICSYKLVVAQRITLWQNHFVVRQT